MSSKINQTLLNLTVLFVALCITALAAEILVRFFYIELGREDKWVGADKRWYEYDSLYGWRKIPNTKATRISIKGQNSVFYEVNSKGLRGSEYPYKKTENEYRVLFLGDSFTEGYMVEMEDHFAEVLEQNLNKLGRQDRFESLNSGTAGWGTDQELLFFLNEGKKYKPDLTVLMFYQNDLAYNNEPKDWSMYYKPLFKEINGDLVLTNVPVPKPDKAVNYDQLTGEKISFVKRAREWLHVNSHLYGVIKERIKNTHSVYQLAVNLGLMEKSGNEKWLPREYNLWEKTYNESVRASWSITEAMIKKLKEETDAIGSKLLVFYVPHEASVHREIWTRLKNNYGFSEEKYDVDQPGLELEAVCKRNGIDFMNPTEVLKAKAAEMEKTGNRVYDPLDHHWNVHGYRFVGEILKEFVVERYLENEERS